MNATNATAQPQTYPAPPLPDRDAIEDAAQFIATLVPPTPQYVWPQVAAAFGAEVWLKHENHTPIGAFKARSAAMYFQKLMRREPGCRGVVTATRGNHGQAVGLAARRFKLPATVFVPHGNSVEKNHAMRALGVKLIEHGHDFQESREEAARVRCPRRLAHGAVVSRRHRARCRQLLGRAVSRGAGSRCGLRAHRPGLWRHAPPRRLAMRTRHEQRSWVSYRRTPRRFRNPSRRVAWSKRRWKRSSATAWPAAGPIPRHWPSFSPT